MNSEVDFTFGFNCWSVATGTPDFVEMTPKVSPACTVQNRGVDALVVVRPDEALVDVDTVLCGAGTTAEVIVRVDVPACRPERMSKMPTVAASKNAAGATYRRQSSRGTTSRMRSRSPA
jgi:hypothetical protein